MIVANGLTKRYRKTLAVDGVCFDVQPGRVTGFLGPNGAGKSTTMRMIMGLDTPSSGTVRVNGHLFGELAWPLREVGALLEAKAYHPGRSARQHLTAQAQTNDIPRTRVQAVIELVGLATVADKRAGTFSLGMGQRLGIAAALLGDPGVLVFDEPGNGLDPEGIRWIRTLLKGLASEGRTVFVSSHLISEMALTVDHLVIIGRGRIVTEASIADLIASNSDHVVRVRTNSEQALTTALQHAGGSVTADDGALRVVGLTPTEIGDIAGAQHLALHELSPQLTSLEDAFMDLTRDTVEYRGPRTDALHGTRSR